MNFRKWNIIIITLFITIVVGLIGIVTTKYVVNLIKISSENHKYYKAYYNANAGLELELLKVKNHNFWFEDKVLSWSDTVKKNLVGYKKWNFQSSIHSQNKYITNNPREFFDDSINCNDEKNWIVLWTWQSYMFPLFYDKNRDEWVFSWENLKLIDISNAELYFKWTWILSITTNKREKLWKTTIWNENWTNIKTKLSNPTFDLDDRPFLNIWATNGSWKFCISNSSNKMNTQYIFIKSEWKYLNSTVQLKVIRTNKWASFGSYGIY